MFALAIARELQARNIPFTIHTFGNTDKPMNELVEYARSNGFLTDPARLHDYANGNTRAHIVVEVDGTCYDSEGVVGRAWCGGVYGGRNPGTLPIWALEAWVKEPRMWNWSYDRSQNPEVYRLVRQAFKQAEAQELADEVTQEMFA